MDKVQTIKLDKFLDSRGWSLNDVFAKVSSFETDSSMEKCQINISNIFPGRIKAWHRHEHQTDYFCVVKGNAQVGVSEDSLHTKKIFIGEDNPIVVRIPPGVMHGIKSIGGESCTLVYFVTNKYNGLHPDEEREPWDAFGEDFWEDEKK